MKKHLGLLLLGLAILWSSACQKPAEQPAGGKLIIPLTSDPATYDPARMWDASTHGRTSALLYNGLMRTTIDGAVVPDLADSVQVALDGLTYTFFLRPNVVFANGQPLTAADVKYSFERFLRTSTSTWILERIVGATDYIAAATDSTDTLGVSGIRIINPTTVELTITEPFAPFLSMLTLPQTYIICADVVEQLGEDYGQHPVGTGPFVLQEWQPDQYLIFEANPDYFGPKPKVRTIEYRIIKEELTALAEFEMGNLSFIPIPDAEYDRIRTDERWKDHIVTRNMLDIYALNLNCAKPPFDHVKVRQAMNYAIDRQTILERLLNGRGTVAKGPVPPGLPGFNIDLEGYDYDPDKARQLLREAGYPEGFSFEIWQSSSNAILAVSEAFQGYLREVGIEARIIQNEWSVLKTAVRRGDIDSYYRAWVADYPDAENFLFPVFHSSQPPGSNLNYSNPEFDELIELAQRTYDPTHRIGLYHVAEQKVVQDAPWVFFYHATESWVHQPNVKGLELPLIYNANKMTDVWVDSE